METIRSASPNLRLRRERIQRDLSQQKLADLLGTTQVTISRWEGGSQQPNTYFREKLCALFGKSVQDLGLISVEPPSPTQQDALEAGPAQSPSTEAPGLWTVPYLRNPHFTGREDLLEQLAQRLSAQECASGNMCRAALTQPQAIKGLGGIGKTQIAVEYAYRAREQGRYTHLFWINAANEEVMIASFLTLADQLPAFAAREEKDQRKLIAAIHRWLQECRDPWLLIVDNADDPTLIQPYLPQQGLGSILLTTRTTAVGSLAASLEVEQMGLMEGTQFLLHRAQRLPATDEESNEASNVVIALDGFPLALDQAGAYIEETGCSFGDYLQLYEQHRSKMLARRGKQVTNYPDSVATTWDLSFQKIEQAQPAAAELLRLCAYLSPDHIPEELLIEGAAHWPPLLQQAVTDALRFNELLEALLAFSMVKRLVHERLLSLHRLVQAVQMDRMAPDERWLWAQRVVYAVNALFPTDAIEVDAWPLCLRYLEQAQACDQLIEQYCLQLPEAADLLNRAGVYLREHASYSLAEPLFKRGLVIAEQQLGLEHPLVADALYGLGILYYQQGKYELAEPLYQRALRIREQALGPEHPLVAMPLNNLGILYRQQGKYELAEPLHQRALRIQEQALGSEHPQLAYPLTSLGSLYREQGKYELAEPLYQRALRIREQALGPEHLLVANPLNDLGILYYHQGKYELAISLFQQALHIWEQALGLEHPQVSLSLNNLGELYRIQGKYELAEPLYQRALRIQERVLGPEHPQLAYPLASLGSLYTEQGKYELAEPSYQRALRIREQALGPEHPQLAMLLNQMGILYHRQGKYELAEPLYQRALCIWEQSLGSKHSQVAMPLNNLGDLYYQQGKYELAEPLYQRALCIWEQSLGPEHPQLAEPLNGLGNLSREQNQYEQAETFYRRALTLRQEHLGPQHIEFAETLQDLARLREMQQQLNEALALYQQALTIREQVLGAEHPKTLDTRQRLYSVLQAQGKTEGAAVLAAHPSTAKREERQNEQSANQK